MRCARPVDPQHRVVSCWDIVSAEALDGSKDIIGGFDPSEGFGIGVVPVDERGDVRPEGGYAAIDAGLIFLSVRSAKKRSIWLSHDEPVGVRCTCQRGLLARHLRISGVLCVT
jgi:hypothetical protein